MASKVEAKKLGGSRTHELFCSPSALLEPSWRQVAIFIDFRRVLASLGSLRGLSWEGFGPILAPSGAYLGLPSRLLPYLSWLSWLSRPSFPRFILLIFAAAIFKHPFYQDLTGGRLWGGLGGFLVILPSLAGSGLLPSLAGSGQMGGGGSPNGAFN